MKKQILDELSWMQEFRFADFESPYIKTALVHNDSDIGYMQSLENCFGHQEMLLSWLKMALPIYSL